MKAFHNIVCVHGVIATVSLHSCSELSKHATACSLFVFKTVQLFSAPCTHVCSSFLSQGIGSLCLCAIINIIANKARTFSQVHVFFLIPSATHYSHADCLLDVCACPPPPPPPPPPRDVYRVTPLHRWFFQEHPPGTEHRALR